MIFKVNIEKLKKESEKALASHGLNAEYSSLVADSMIDADLSGISTHGIRMLPSYIEKIDNGFFSLEEPEIIESKESFSIVDAHGTIGAISAYFCSRIAVSNAKLAGVHVVFSRNCNTFGVASYYTDMIARNGMIGISLSNSPAAMPLANGAEPMLGTNPIAFSCPSKSQGIITIDMATSVVAKSKFALYKQEGKPLPDGWALDETGAPTNDPMEGIKGLVLPMAGFKGYGIAMMIDIISGVLSGAGYLNKVNKFYSASNESMNVGQTFIAIDPSIIYGNDFQTLMDGYIETARNSKAMDGETIIIPGDRRKSNRNKAKHSGFDIAIETANKLAGILIEDGADYKDFIERICNN